MTRIKFRRGTTAQWTTANPILATGEPGYEDGQNKLKIGDGIKDWITLPYIAGSGGMYGDVDGGGPTSVYGGTDPVDGGGI